VAVCETLLIEIVGLCVQKWSKASDSSVVHQQIDVPDTLECFQSCFDVSNIDAQRDNAITLAMLRT
jgi:hypothetical protein